MKISKKIFMILFTLATVLSACGPSGSKYGGGVIVASLVNNANSQLFFDDMVTNNHHTVSLPRSILGYSVSLSGQIVYAGGSKLYSFNEESGETELISVGDMLLSSPKWSRDGNNVVFTAIEGRSYSYLFDVKQHIMTNLSINSNLSDHSVAWIDDTHILLFSDSSYADVLQGPDSISTIRIDGTGRKSIYQWPSNYSINGIYLSPDGKTLVLHVNEFTKSETLHYVELFSLGDQTERALPDIPFDSTFFTWSPDGKYIAYIQGNGIYLYELNTGNVIKLSVSDANYDGLIWVQMAN